jgi:3-oxoacyl-[acyl-carrier-protein] synthase-3
MRRIKMNSIEILANGAYLPANKIQNEELNKRYNLDETWIYKRTGIKQRYSIKHESITDLAILSVKDLLNKSNFDIQKVGIIIVATTSTKVIMPGISFEVQKAFNIENCKCIDILAGCSGYINAFDLVRKYIALNEVEYGLVIGVETLTEFLDYDDINTAILLGDGAGATLIGRSNENKEYFCNISSDGKNGELLTCISNEKMYMDGINIYKFAISKTSQNISDLLSKNNLNINDVKYIVPHQSNVRIMEKICEKLSIDISKMYVNIENVGNTFCASIPIALSEMYEKGLVSNGDKLLLVGYGRRTKLWKHIIGGLIYEIRICFSWSGSSI